MDARRSPRGSRRGDRPRSEANIERAIDWFYRAQGSTNRGHFAPHSDTPVPEYYIVATPKPIQSRPLRRGPLRHRSAEAKDVLGLFTKTRGEGFGDEIKRRVILAHYVLSSGYYDAYPAGAKGPPPILGELRAGLRAGRRHPHADLADPRLQARRARPTTPLAMYLSDIYTISVNPSTRALPANSVPQRFTESGLPIGLQVIGKSLRRGRAFRHRPRLRAGPRLLEANALALEALGRKRHLPSSFINHLLSKHLPPRETPPSTNRSHVLRSRHTDSKIHVQKANPHEDVYRLRHTPTGARTRADHAVVPRSAEHPPDA